ncbi:hypothetical protein C0033_14190 [Clostridium sp. chh4-2]|uniref:Crp/Fnr family transcriptional regulator n=1 Tax=Clostridium sp. chh4-2 TaxID=2067550 RepID=UPI000CCE4115|nr:Crp/Fnr family transcriptional regulator [Clostridium sp. chh4-2]PNV61437.1 hypothetical protein C0033_14190 [Clostridium sp. chh4-2]
MQQWEPLLMQCPIFKHISATDVRQIMQDVPYQTVSLEKGEIIYRAEETANRIGIILSGCIEARKYLSTGNVISLFQRKSGEMIGGGIVFSSHPKYPCDVIAKEKSILLWLDRQVVLGTFLKNPAIASNIMRIYSDRIMQLEKRMELFSFYSISKKIAFSLLHDFSIDENQTIYLPFSKTTWAEYLNVSRTSLSRELKIMCSQKIITMNKNEIRILQAERLEALLY